MLFVVALFGMDGCVLLCSGRRVVGPSMMALFLDHLTVVHAGVHDCEYYCYILSVLVLIVSLQFLTFQSVNVSCVVPTKQP